MKRDNYWSAFAKTGRVEDYLRYCGVDIYENGVGAVSPPRPRRSNRPMRLTTDALIIRENNNIGESDRFVTALTRELGAVHASARGARTLKNRGNVATRLLSYSRLTLREGRSRDKYIIEDAAPAARLF